MKKLLTSALLTVVAVPFLMAAPKATKKVQSTTPAATATAKPKVARKHHVKKSVTKKTSCCRRNAQQVSETKAN